MMLNKELFNQNMAPLDEQQKQKIIDILEAYYNRIDGVLQDLAANEQNMWKQDRDCIDGHLLASYLLAIGDGYDFLLEKKRWLNNVYNILVYFKKNIEHYDSLALFHGLTDMAFALLGVTIKSGEFSKFLKSLNKIVCDLTMTKLTKIENENTLVQHYDIIIGMTGVGRYLLMYIESLGYIQDCTTDKKALVQILRYLVKKSANITVEDKEIIGFYVTNENLWPVERRTQYLHGTLDFGVAHGIAGPLALMAYSAARNISVDSQQLAIEKLISVMDEHKTVKNDIMYWPMILPAELYKKQNVAATDTRMSWCYGSIGISCVLYQAYKCLGKDGSEYLRNMEIISKTPLRFYNLLSPIICHGFAGTMAIFNQIYRETSFKELLPGLYMCLDEILNLYNPDFKYGFKNIDYGPKDLPEEDDDSYLNGTTGVILALLSLFNPGSMHEKHLLIS